jgi:hypothetical protein
VTPVDTGERVGLIAARLVGQRSDSSFPRARAFTGTSRDVPRPITQTRCPRLDLLGERIIARRGASAYEPEHTFAA